MAQGTISTDVRQGGLRWRHATLWLKALEVLKKSWNLLVAALYERQSH